MRLFIFGIFLISCVVAQTTISAHSETVIVKMTTDGFEPQSVTVDQNASIIFLNEDSKDRWPASNNHPVHDIYPEFDPKKPIPPGGSWPFKPKKAGEWKFHDHLFPHMRGTLLVEAESDATSVNIESPNWLENIKTFFLNLQGKVISLFTKKENPLTSWNNLKEKFKGQGGSTGNVHDQAHLIGGQIFEKEGLKGLSKCSPEFAFGCFHGFLDKAFQKNLDQLNVVEEACKTLGEGGPASSCIHGIGHGVASFYQTADLKAALSACRRLSPQGLQYCFDGVFMEFERGAPGSLYSKDNPYKPCDELEKDFGEEIIFACGRNQPTVLMSRFKFSFEDVIGVCLKSKSDQFKIACFDALGFITTKSTSDPAGIITACQKIGVGQYILRCVKAAAGELIFQEVPGWQEKAPAVCQLLEPDYQNDCHQYIQQLIRQYGRLMSKEDEAKYIRDKLKVCYDAGGRDGCYKNVAALFFKQFGLKKTLSLLAENEGYTEVYARCHEVTHYLSRSEYERLGSIAKVYAQCDSTCHGGCYHGTLEAFLKEKQLQTGTNITQEFPKICGKDSDYQKPIEFNECFHGLGHAAMFVTDMELRESLKLCDTLSDQAHIERCYTGVFMENSSSSTSFDHASIYIKPDDPYYPCNALEEKYLPICWQYQSSYFSIISGQDWKKVAQMCLQIPVAYQDRCFRTIGTNQVGFTLSLSTMKQDCDLMPAEHFKDICVSGVVSSLSYRFVGNSQKMIDFCSLVDYQNRESCFKQAGTGILDWDKNKDVAKKECSKISDQEGKNWCLGVI